jgi:hypothetical protein
LEDPDVERRRIIKCTFPKWNKEDVNWIDMNHYRDKCRALLNAAMKLRVPQNVGFFIFVFIP